MGPCTQLPGSSEPAEVCGTLPCSPPPFLLLQFNHCPPGWRGGPAAPAVFAIAPGLCRAKGTHSG